MKVKALDESNCGAARHGGKEAGVKAASPRTETTCEAGSATEWLDEQGVTNLPALWLAYHSPRRRRSRKLRGRPRPGKHDGTTGCGPARPVVWGPVADYHQLPASASASQLQNARESVVRALGQMRSRIDIFKQGATEVFDYGNLAWREFS